MHFASTITYCQHKHYPSNILSLIQYKAYKSMMFANSTLLPPRNHKHLTTNHQETVGKILGITPPCMVSFQHFNHISLSHWYHGWPCRFEISHGNSWCIWKAVVVVVAAILANIILLREPSQWVLNSDTIKSLSFFLVFLFVCFMYGRTKNSYIHFEFLIELE